jgi:hypothetical protein
MDKACFRIFLIFPTTLHTLHSYKESLLVKENILVTTWLKEPYIDTEKKEISVVFTWQLNQIEKWLIENNGYFSYRIGGPAINLFPNRFPPEMVINKENDNFLQKHNPEATRTTIGCPRNCKFCGVSKINPVFKEIKEFPILPIICDDNFLACSRQHFDYVINRLKFLDWCDFNQGLDARLLKQYHADKFAELKNPKIRIAWDNINQEKDIISAITKLRKAKIPRKNIQCYVLIGFNDTPTDALYRLETLRFAFGINPNPMRYQKLNSTRRNEWLSKNWTMKELDRYMAYWANLRFTGSVPFNEFIR